MWESKHFHANYLTKFSIDLDGIFYTVETRRCDEPHTHFISSIQYSRERTLLVWFFFKKINIALCSDIYRPISKLYISYQFGLPWPSFKVTVVWDIKNIYFHFLANLRIDLDEIQYVATTCSFVEAQVRFFFFFFFAQYSRERTLLIRRYEIYV